MMCSETCFFFDFCFVLLCLFFGNSNFLLKLWSPIRPDILNIYMYVYIFFFSQLHFAKIHSHLHAISFLWGFEKSWIADGTSLLNSPLPRNDLSGGLLIIPPDAEVIGYIDP